MGKSRRWLECAVLGALGLVSTQVDAACTFGGGSSEPSLQSTFNNLLGSATVNVQTACMDDGADAYWAAEGESGYIRILVELAGNRQTNTFGVYDPILGGAVQLFEGSDGSGAQGEIEISESNGQWSVRVRERRTNGTWRDQDWSAATNIGSPVIGFYLGTQSNGRFYSNTAFNGDGMDHMYAYGPLGGSTYTGQYIIAWEDVALQNGADRDYQDFVAMLRDITPVPLPAAAWLLMSGLIGLVGVSRRTL